MMLSSCATQAQRQSEAIGDRVTAAFQAQAVCYAQAKTKPELARVRTYLVADEDDPAKLQKLSDQRHADEAMRSDLAAAHQLTLPCRSAFKSQMASIHPSYGQVAANTFSAEDRLLLGVLKGQLTIGQANELSLDLDRSTQQAWVQADNEVNQEFANAHAAEMQQRQAAALAMSQYNQQLQQQQQHQQMMNTLNRPTTTNCQAWGNAMNCRTW